MSWTDERVERLSALWLEGRSASQIAAELGEGVSRNAVIGKVHRLGLSGRAVPPAEAAAPRIREVAPPEPVSEVPTTVEPAPAEAVPEAPALAAHGVDDVAAILDAAEPITIGDNVWLGGGVIVLPGVTIGADTVVGAGAVVPKDLPAGVVAVGNPARIVKDVPW